MYSLTFARSRDAKLTVHVPPEAPVIINGHELRTTEDRETDIKCVSRGGKPAAEVRTSYSSEEAFLPLTQQPRVLLRAFAKKISGIV